MAGGFITMSESRWTKQGSDNFVCPTLEGDLGHGKMDMVTIDAAYSGYAGCECDRGLAGRMGDGKGCVSPKTKFLVVLSDTMIKEGSDGITKQKVPEVRLSYGSISEWVFEPPAELDAAECGEDSIDCTVRNLEFKVKLMAVANESSTLEILDGR